MCVGEGGLDGLGGEVPEDDVTVISAGCKDVSKRVEGYGIDGIAVGGGEFGALRGRRSGHIPEGDGVVGTADGKGISIF